MKETQIIETLLAWNKAYRNGKPLVSDTEYDKLLDELKGKNNKTYNEIRPILFEEKGDFKHPVIVGSLEKLKAGDDKAIQEWELEHRVPDQNKWVISAKVDGLSLIAIYVNAKLTYCITRGDGYYGKDKTDKLAQCLPETLPSHYKGLTIIRGEIVLTREAFENINSTLKKPYKAIRNAAVGLVNDKSTYSECKNLKFIAYQIYKSNPQFDTYANILEELENLGFDIPLYYTAEFKKKPVLNTNVLMKVYDAIKEEADYEIDGLVIANNNKFNEVDSYLPDYSIAFKSNLLVAQTEIEDISWEISKDGSLRPVAIVRPVMLGGAEITRASVYNFEYVLQEGLGVGAKVELQKSGDIIPCITKTYEKSKQFDYPRTCPYCGAETEVRGKQLYCTNKNCQKANAKSVAHFLKNLGVEVASEKSLDNWGIHTIPDLIEWSYDFDKSKKQMVKFYNELQTKLFPISLEKLVCSFDYSGIGSKIIKKIIKSNSVKSFIEFVFQDNLEFSLELPKGTTANTLVRLKNAVKVNNLSEAFELITSDNRWKHFDEERERENRKMENKQSLPLVGKSFCFTGALSISRPMAQAMVEQLGGENKSGVSRGLTYLVTQNPNSGSSKNKKAKELGTEVISEVEFFKMVNYNSERGEQIQENDISDL